MITLTKKAVDEIQKITTEQNMNSEEIFLRVGVRGGGCSGYQYTMDITDNKQDNDEMFECDGVRVIVDPKSLIYITGTTIDFKDELMGRGFAFDNPSSTGRCGCGSSFSA